MKVDKTDLFPGTIEKYQNFSEMELKSQFPMRKNNNYLLELFIKNVPHNLDRRYLLSKEEDVVRVLSIALYLAENRYNQEENFKEKIKVEFGLGDNILRLIQNHNDIIDEIVALKKHNNSFAPISFKLIFFLIDRMIFAKIFVNVINELCQDQIKRYLKKGKYEDKSTPIMKIILNFNRENKKHQEIVFLLKLIQGELNISDDLWKSFIHNKIENYIIPILLEDNFMEFTEMSSREKIKVIFPLYLKINPDFKDRMDSKNYADSEKELIDRLYNKIYRRNR
jgi:hypothetical protein